jgi:hypothetical protein
MAILISGASNSVMLEGWTRQFRHLARASDIANISVGGSSSIMSAYRVLHTADVRRGDIIVWENGVGDEGYISVGMQPDLCLKYTEYVIRHALERGAGVVPVILIPRQSELRVEVSPYRRDLHALFEHYELPYIDVSVELRARLGVPHLPGDVYMDGGHFHPGGAVTDFIAERVHAMVSAGPRVPAPREPRYTGEGRRLVLVNTLEDATVGTFANSLLSIPAYGTLELPLRTEPIPFAGTVEGFAFLARSSGGGACRIKAGDNEVSVALTPLWESESYLLHCICIASLAEEPIAFARGQRVRIVKVRPADAVKCESPYVYAAKVEGPLRRDPDFRFVGFLCEENAAAAAERPRKARAGVPAAAGAGAAARG